MVKVRIPTPLRPMTGGKSEVETQASDIQAMIESLNGQFPGLKSRICDDAGEIRRFVNIYLNEEDIRFMKGKDTPLKDGDQISIVPAIAGGSAGKRPRPFERRSYDPLQSKATGTPTSQLRNAAGMGERDSKGAS